MAEGRVEELIGAETLYIELVVSPVLPADRLAAAGFLPRPGTRRGLSSCCGRRTTDRRTGGSRVFCARGARSFLRPGEEGP